MHDESSHVCMMKVRIGSDFVAKEAKKIVNSLNIDETILNKPFSLIKNEELETLYNKLLQNN